MLTNFCLFLLTVQVNTVLKSKKGAYSSLLIVISYGKNFIRLICATQLVKNFSFPIRVVTVSFGKKDF